MIPERLCRMDEAIATQAIKIATEIRLLIGEIRAGTDRCVASLDRTIGRLDAMSETLNRRRELRRTLRAELDGAKIDP